MSVCVLTGGSRRRDHDTQIGRGAGAADDGRTEETGPGPLRPRTPREPQHLEIAHLAADAVPLSAPYVPHALATGRGVARALR